MAPSADRAFGQHIIHGAPVVKQFIGHAGWAVFDYDQLAKVCIGTDVTVVDKTVAIGVCFAVVR